MQKPFEDWPIDPNTTSGTELAERLNLMVEAVDSNNRGDGRPGYLTAGGLWSRGIDGAVDLYLFDGEKDILVGGSGTAESGMSISENPPPSPGIGDMWMRLPENIVMIWNGDYWFQFPAGGYVAGGGSGDLVDGTVKGQTLRWNGSAWIPTSTLRVDVTEEKAIDVLGEIHLRPPSQPNGEYGVKYLSQIYENAYDPWEDNRADWHMSWIRPADDNTNSKRRNGFDIYGDRFTIRLSENPPSDPWDEQEIVFRADGLEVDVGKRDYATTVFINGDMYVGMSANFRGKVLPTNPKDRPGTTFCGGMAMLGSWNGQSLNPQSQDEIDDPSLIRRRAFDKDAALDMSDNPIYHAADPDDPKWSDLRDSMVPTVEWIKKNAIVSDESGKVVTKNSTQFGDSNADQHEFRGDVYVGYDSGNLPDNNDFVPGTMFLGRGAIIGRPGLLEAAPTASLGLEGNIIWGLGPGTSVDHAVNLAQLNAAKRELAGAIASAVTQSSDFDQLKDNLLSILAPLIQEDES